MSKRRSKQSAADPNDEQELQLAFDPATGLMLALTVVPRSPDNPVPPARKRRAKKEK